MVEEKKEEVKEEKDSPKQEESKKEEKVEDVKKEETPKEEKKEEEKEEEVEIPSKFKQLVESIGSLSVLDLAELVKILEKKFGVSAAVPMMAVAQGANSNGGNDSAEEKSEFDIELQGVGDKKIEVIKVVRDITGKGLKDSKDLVDSIASGPQVIKEAVKKEEAEEIKKKFEGAGAKVELK